MCVCVKCPRECMVLFMCTDYCHCALLCPILLPRPCPNVASGNELGSHPQATVAGRLPCPLRPAGLPLGGLGGCKALGPQTEAGLSWGASPAPA